MKSVLISIQPKWVELIANGKKTVEVRKSKPKLETPFKCYIYCTKGDSLNYLKRFHHKAFDKFWIDNNAHGVNVTRANGKVIGEFVCDAIFPISCYYSDVKVRGIHREQPYTCLTDKEMIDYLGNGVEGYGWHISDLVIYDKPRELSEFYAEGDCDCMNCKKCAWFDSGNGYNVEADCNLAYKGADLHKSFKPILRPPQSWCYVESEDTE